MSRDKLIELLATETYLLYKASLNGTPNCQALFARMTDQIVPGELVLEISHRFGYPLGEYKFDPSSIGYLRQITDGKSRGAIWHVERLTDGKIRTWENCQFVRVQTYA